MSKKKIYYIPLGGQLGNQLSSLAHLIAFANEHGFQVIYPYNESLIANIQPALKNVTFKKLIFNKLISSFLKKLCKFFFLNQNVKLFGLLILNKPYNFDLDYNYNKEPRTIIANEWLIRYYSGIKKHSDFIKDQLSFKQDSYLNGKCLLNELKNKYEGYIFIGVHVRWGDYATWQNGIYFFNISFYQSKIMELSKEIEKSIFIICSNEALTFNEPNCLIVYSKGSAADDIYLLSMCDYIIGPPSTFSGWAAFYGNKPIHFLKKEDKMLNFSDFNHHYL